MCKVIGSDAIRIDAHFTCYGITAIAQFESTNMPINPCRNERICHHFVSFLPLPPSRTSLPFVFILILYAEFEWTDMSTSDECVRLYFFPSNSGTHKRKQAQKNRTLFSHIDLSIAMFSYQTHWLVNWQKILLSGCFFVLLSLVHHRISCLRLWLLGTRLHETLSFMHVYSFITFVCNYAILTESSSSCHCITPLCRLKWTNFE